MEPTDNSVDEPVRPQESYVYRGNIIMMNDLNDNQDHEFESISRDELLGSEHDIDAGDGESSEIEAPSETEEVSIPRSVANDYDHREASRQGNEVLSFVSAIENELNQLRSATMEQATIIEATQEAQRDIEAQRSALDRMREEIDREQERLADCECELTRREKAVNERSTAMEERQAEIDELQRSLGEDEKRFGEWESHLKEQQQGIRSEWDNFKRDREALHEGQQQLEEKKREADAQQSAFDEQLLVFNERNEQLARDREEIDKARTEIEKDQAGLERDRQSLEEQLESLIEEEKRVADLKQEAEQRLHDAAELESRVEERAAHVSQVEKNMRGERDEFNHLQEEYQAKQSAHAAVVHEKEEEISAQRAALQVAKDALARKKMELFEERDDLESAERAIEEKFKQLSLAGDSTCASTVDETAHARIGELEDELNKREEAIRTLSQHYRIIQAELEKQRCADSDSAGAVVAMGGVDQAFLALRKKRLGMERQLIGKRLQQLSSVKEQMSGQLEAVKELASQRALLSKVSKDLADAEQRMMQQWAHAGVVTRLFLGVVAVLLLAGASYFCVMQFVPATYIAKAAVGVQARVGFPLTDEQLHTWQTVNEELATSDTVLKSMAEHLARRGYDNLGSVGDLREFINKSLSVNATSDGAIEFSLIGKGQVDTKRILDTYAVAFISASNASRNKRTDGGKTRLTLPATLDPVPVKDNRLQIAGMAFGGSILLLIPLGGLIYIRLRKVGRVFDTTGDLFVSLADDKKWDSIRRSADGIVEEHVI